VVLLICTMLVKLWLLVSSINLMDICLKRIICVPISSMHELLVCEAYRGGLMGHFGVVKTLDALHKYFYYLKIKKMCNTYMTNA